MQKFNKILLKFWRIIYWLKNRFYYPKNLTIITANRAELYQKIWGDAVDELGATSTDLGYGFIKVSVANKTTIIKDSTTYLDAPVILKMVCNKPLCHKLLMEEKISVPNHLVFNLSDDFSKIENFLIHAPASIVIKPAIGTGGGIGVTTNITNKHQLIKAIAFSSLGHSTLIAEQMITGDCYRFLYLDGELIDAVVRRPPAILGDGKHSIEELIKLETQRRINSSNLVAVADVRQDLDFTMTLKLQNLTLRSIPKEGERIILKTVINDGSANDSESVLSLVCEQLKNEGAKAAAALGVRLAGVDILTDDLSKPLAESKGVVLEVNTTPGLHLHYLTKNPCTPPATKILKVILNNKE